MLSYHTRTNIQYGNLLAYSHEGQDSVNEKIEQDSRFDCNEIAVLPLLVANLRTINDGALASLAIHIERVE